MNSSAEKSIWDVLVIGAGPAGMAAAAEASKRGVSVLMIEREESSGGILNQCIHDGFGLIRYGEQLSGPEYAEREHEALSSFPVTEWYHTTIIEIEKCDGLFMIKAVSAELGIVEVTTKSIVLATGCRERTVKQIFIQGDRPAGVYTAGLAQYLINRMGYLPGKRCVILGSGDIGLIMARRLTLEGASVPAVYEIQSEPSGLTRNIVQCLEDFGIPLYVKKTVTKLYGKRRLEAVTVMDVDDKKNPIAGTEERIPCDCLIVSVGLIPEHDMVAELGMTFDPVTQGPIVDQNYMCSVPGIFCCGNALHVNDLVDYVSESGEIAGSAAARYPLAARSSEEISITYDDTIRSVVPHTIGFQGSESIELPLYIRSSRSFQNVWLAVMCGSHVVIKKRQLVVRPPEMMKVAITVDHTLLSLKKPLIVSIQEETP